MMVLSCKFGILQTGNCQGERHVARLNHCQMGPSLSSFQEILANQTEIIAVVHTLERHVESGG
ncbi:MAG TPA: hypothetical protein DEF79_02595 [Gammaproteobacteria bacterium]|nr:hypothetical protein [Gammaproteobacteria bacterium]